MDLQQGIGLWTQMQLSSGSKFTLTLAANEEERAHQL